MERREPGGLFGRHDSQDRDDRKWERTDKAADYGTAEQGVECFERSILGCVRWSTVRFICFGANVVPVHSCAGDAFVTTGHFGIPHIGGGWALRQRLFWCLVCCWVDLPPGCHAERSGS